MSPREGDALSRLAESLAETSGIGPSYIDGVDLALWSGGFSGFLEGLGVILQLRDPRQFREPLESLRTVAYQVRDTPELRQLAERHAEEARKRKVVAGLLGPDWFVYGFLVYTLIRTLLPILESETDITRVKRIQKRFGVDRKEAIRLLRIFEEVRNAKPGLVDTVKAGIEHAKRRGFPPKP